MLYGHVQQKLSIAKYMTEFILLIKIIYYKINFQ